MYIYHSFLIHSSAEGHLGCFHLGYFQKYVLFQDLKKKKTLRKWESWDPGNKDLRQEKDEGNEEEDVEFGYCDESLLEA